MKISQSNLHSTDLQKNQNQVEGRQQREHGKMSSKQHNNRSSGGLAQQDINSFQDQMKAAEMRQLGVVGRMNPGQDQQEKGQGDGEAADPMELAGARLLAASDPAEARQIAHGSPFEIMTSSRSVSVEARVEKTVKMMTSQIEQTLRAEAKADVSDGRVLSLELDAQRFGISGLKVMSTHGAMTVVLERVTADVSPGDVQAAAQGLLSALQNRFPDRKVRILDRLEEQGLADGVEASDNGLTSVSALLSGAGSRET